MKKLTKVCLSMILCLLFLFTLPVSALASPKVIVNGNQLTFDVNPVIIGGRTLVPLRGIVEALGADVIWNERNQTITVTGNDKTIKLTIESNIAEINNVKTVTDMPAKIINNRTMVPLRFIAQGFDADVKWDGNSNTVIISKNTYSTITQNKLQDIQNYSIMYFETVDTIKTIMETLELANIKTLQGYNTEKQLNDINQIIDELIELFNTIDIPEGDEFYQSASFMKLALTDLQMVALDSQGLLYAKKLGDYRKITTRSDAIVKDIDRLIKNMDISSKALNTAMQKYKQ